MKIAICPGSFDPITLGHLDIIKRAARIFDEVVVLVVINPDKCPSFSAKERVSLIKKSLAEESRLKNIRVDMYEGLLINYVDVMLNSSEEIETVVIAKGLRAVTDFEYEFQMALTNKKLMPTIETIFLNTSMEYMYLSSSLVKQIARFGGNISEFVPTVVREEIENRLKI